MGVYDELAKISDELSPSKTRSHSGKHSAGVQQQTARNTTPNLTSSRDESRATSRVISSAKPRENPRVLSHDLPTRDEIQQFSFRLRDELKVKVQAEVPHQWQAELDSLARKLNVKKLELYRFILGRFLGKIPETDAT